MRFANILVVEDSEADRELLKWFFETRKITNAVRMVRNIAEAREAIKEEHFDLMFIDENLPDGSGISFVEEVDMDAHDVVILSGTTPSAKVCEAAALGVLMYIQKPLDDDDVAALTKERARLTRPFAVRCV